MNWLALILVGLVLAGVGFFHAKVYDPKNGVVSCCGCGACAAAGECVMTKKTAKKQTSVLTNVSKKI